MTRSSRRFALGMVFSGVWMIVALATHSVIAGQEQSESITRNGAGTGPDSLRGGAYAL